MTITITVASKKPPAEGKKQWTITDSTGKKWGVFPDKADLFQDFMTYEILDYGTNQFNNRTYYTIKEAKMVGGTLPSKPPQPSTIPYKTITPQSQITDDQRRLDIFVCGAFNNILSNSAIHPLGMDVPIMVDILNKLKQAWKQTLGPGNPSIAAMHNQDINDEIPE